MYIPGLGLRTGFTLPTPRLIYICGASFQMSTQKAQASAKKHPYLGMLSRNRNIGRHTNSVDRTAIMSEHTVPWPDRVLESCIPGAGKIQSGIPLATLLVQPAGSLDIAHVPFIKAEVYQIQVYLAMSQRVRVVSSATPIGSVSGSQPRLLTQRSQHQMFFNVCTDRFNSWHVIPDLYPGSQPYGDSRKVTT